MDPSDTPPAEVGIDVALVRALVGSQFSYLASMPITHLSSGWDNVSFRLGSEHLVRLPRRQIAVPLIEHEARWLRVLGPALPLPVPVPEHVGRPDEGYPWPWLIVPYLKGTPAAVAGDIDHAACARLLASFLLALHRPAPSDHPRNPHRGTPLSVRDAALRQRLPLLDRHDRDVVTRLWEGSLAAPEHDDEPIWIHGDLHPLNVLVDQGVVSGVIDFGDITGGDPATDLAIVWSLLSSAQEQFWSVYGDDEALRLRARGWAIALGLAYLANSADNPVMETIGRVTIDAVIAHS
jgi:aminoglycoside phosphotransferase (APT) family kinase protein